MSWFKNMKFSTPEQTQINVLSIYSTGAEANRLQPWPMWLLRKETNVFACHVIHPVWEDQLVSGEEGGICQPGPFYTIMRWREGSFQLVRRWWSPSNCIAGLVWMLKLLAGQGWTWFLFFSSRRRGRRTWGAAQLKGDAVDLRDAPAAPLSSSGPRDRSEPQHLFRAISSFRIEFENSNNAIRHVAKLLVSSKRVWLEKCAYVVIQVLGDSCEGCGSVWRSVNNVSGERTQLRKKNNSKKQTKKKNPLHH